MLALGTGINVFCIKSHDEVWKLRLDIIFFKNKKPWLYTRIPNQTDYIIKLANSYPLYERMIMLINLVENTNLLENAYELSIATLLLCSVFSVRLLKKVKRERKLSAFELTMDIIIRVAIFLWLASFLLLQYGA